VLIQESFVNATEGYRFGDSEPQEPYTDDVGELYRTLRAEYGRCIGKVYVDTDDGPKAVGWVFQSRDRYEDSNETYLREVWITLYDRYDRVIEADYHAIGGGP
jgi:hypothetical protein